MSEVEEWCERYVKSKYVLWWPISSNCHFDRGEEIRGGAAALFSGVFLSYGEVRQCSTLWPSLTYTQYGLYGTQNFNHPLIHPEQHSVDHFNLRWSQMAKRSESNQSIIQYHSV